MPPEPTSTVRLKYSVDLDYNVLTAGSDFIFNVQASHTRQQHVLHETLTLSQPVLPHAYVDPATQARQLRLRANVGQLKLHYDAVLDVTHHRASPATLAETWIPNLPGQVLPYLYPSRYCESDKLNRFAMIQFGGMWQGYGRVQAIRDWVNANVAFVSNSSSGTTTACDTLIAKQGVCRISRT